MKIFSQGRVNRGAKQGRKGRIPRFLGQKRGDWRWEDGNAMYSVGLQIVVPTLRGYGMDPSVAPRQLPWGRGAAGNEWAEGGRGNGRGMVGVL